MTGPSMAYCGSLYPASEMSERYQPIHQRLIFRAEATFDRANILAPLLFRPRSADHGADEPVSEYPSQGRNAPVPSRTAARRSRWAMARRSGRHTDSSIRQLRRQARFSSGGGTLSWYFPIGPHG
jgi:hypothetical protein